MITFMGQVQEDHFMRTDIMQVTLLSVYSVYII